VKNIFDAVKYMSFSLDVYKFFFKYLDINIDGGNGENVLHIAAQSDAIWQPVRVKVYS